MRLIVGEATREIAQPASTEALRLLRKALKRRQRNLRKAHELEAGYLKQQSHAKRVAAQRRAEALEDTVYKSTSVQVGNLDLSDLLTCELANL